MSKETKKDYQERINLVLNFIDENLSTSMELNTLAQIGCFSPFHFHRLFKAFVGESLGSYIKRKRLEWSAHMLIYSQLAVAEIGYQIGYETPSSYSVAFQKYFGGSPSDFRKQPQNFKKERKMNVNVNKDYKADVRIEDVASMEVAFVRAKGYNETAISGAWNKIIPFALEKGFFTPPTTVCIGINVDNPEITAQDECEYHACLGLNKPIKPEGEVSVKTLKGGKYAIFTHRGPYDGMAELYTFIFKHWLEESGNQLREAEVFDKYLNSIKNTAPQDLVTEVHIPIE